MSFDFFIFILHMLSFLTTIVGSCDNSRTGFRNLRVLGELLFVFTLCNRKCISSMCYRCNQT